jgi:hypothetical protein
MILSPTELPVFRELSFITLGPMTSRLIEWRIFHGMVDVKSTLW